jgi:hypothetical protein
MTCIRKPTICRANCPLWAAVVVCVLGWISSASAEPACSATPQTAVARFLGRATAETEPEALGHGFRVWRAASDPGLKRQWIWIEACGGQARPAQLISLPLDGRSQTRNGVQIAAAPISQQSVHTGDSVVVVESDKELSVRLSGVALEAGQQGARVHVRIPAWHNGEVLVGTVSGKDEIRLLAGAQRFPLPQPSLSLHETTAGESDRDQ